MSVSVLSVFVCPPVRQVTASVHRPWSGVVRVMSSGAQRTFVCEVLPRWASGSITSVIPREVDDDGSVRGVHDLTSFKALIRMSLFARVEGVQD